MAAIGSSCLRPLPACFRLILHVVTLLSARTIRWLPSPAVAFCRRHESSDASVRTGPKGSCPGTVASCGATGRYRQQQVLFRRRRSPRNCKPNWARRLCIRSNGPGTNEVDRSLSCARSCGHQRLLYGWRPRLGTGMSPADCFAPCCIRPSRCGPRVDHRVGRHSAPATADREGQGDGNVLDR